MSGGLTAAGLLVLFLALIGAGVGLYYAFICLQARPLRPKKPKDAEHGPLIPPDPDVNGNHEDVPLEASAPLHDDADADSKLHPDLPDQANSLQDLKRAGSPEPPNKKEDVLISVEEDVPPAKVTHEKETAPIVNHVAPLGFVVPPSVASSQETPLDHHPMPRNLQPLQKQPQPQPLPLLQPQPQKVESSPSKSTLVPVYIPPPPQKKPIAISDEEDGLLLQEPAPQDNGLNPELCATLPVSHSPLKKEESKITLQNNPPAKPPKPEGTAPVIPPRQPPITLPEMDGPLEAEAQPVVGVVPHLAPSCPEKDEMKPVRKAPDTLPPENCNKPASVYMKNDEHFPSSVTSKASDNEMPVPTTDEIRAAVPTPPETINKDLVNKICVDSDDSLPTEGPVENIEAPPESVESSETAKNSPDDRTEPTPEDEVDKEPRSNANYSVSSEEPELPYNAPVSTEVRPPIGAEPVITVESHHPQPVEDAEALTDNIPASPPSASEPACPPVNTSKEHLLNTPEKDRAPNVIVHSSADETEDLSDASSDVSDADCEDPNIPTEVLLTPPKAGICPDKEASATPSQPTADVPIDASSVPVEACSTVPDDPSDEEDSPLPIIKKEGSAENNSEGTDTESSEPEVTEYSFSSGPSAPSTTGILANEVSCTMEPKVTRFAPITDMNALESEDSEISDEDLEEDDLASSSEVSEEEIHDSPDTLVENKALTEGKPADIPGKSNAISDYPDILEQNAAPNVKPNASSTGPTSDEAPVSAPDAASKLPGKEAVDSCDSETESEGAEAEVELREEMVSIPAVVCDNINNHTTKSPTPLSTNHTSSLSETCPPKPQPLKSPQGNDSSLEEIPGVTDEDDGLSISTPESCDLSDGEVTASTPKKSMIPRLVKHSEA